MQPACQDLPVVPGTTYRDTFRLMQPEFVYRPIASIAGAPAQLVVPAHGLVGDWPIWVRRVMGMQGINREPQRELPWPSRRIDADTLEINSLSADGERPQGGQLVYQPPVDLAGASVVMTFTGQQGDDLVLTLGAGLVVAAPGTITRELTPEQTALLVGEWRYTLDVQYADGTVTRYAQGGQRRGGCCHG
ncbi:hypothetical protein D9M68_254120 [compost metagenome]